MPAGSLLIVLSLFFLSHDDPKCIFPEDTHWQAQSHCSEFLFLWVFRLIGFLVFYVILFILSFTFLAAESFPFMCLFLLLLDPSEWSFFILSVSWSQWSLHSLQTLSPSSCVLPAVSMSSSELVQPVKSWQLKMVIGLEREDDFI